MELLNIAENMGWVYKSFNRNIQLSDVVVKTNKSSGYDGLIVTSIRMSIELLGTEFVVLKNVQTFYNYKGCRNPESRKKKDDVNDELHDVKFNNIKDEVMSKLLVELKGKIQAQLDHDNRKVFNGMKDAYLSANIEDFKNEEMTDLSREVEKLNEQIRQLNFKKNEMSSRIASYKLGVFEKHAESLGFSPPETGELIATIKTEKNEFDLLY
jgi:polyhydroxyalkanoate synthesis regulator phasin